MQAAPRDGVPYIIAVSYMERRNAPRVEHFDWKVHFVVWPTLNTSATVYLKILIHVRYLVVASVGEICPDNRTGDANNQQNCLS